MVPKFNANIKFKLKFKWLNNMDINLLNNNKVGKFNVPSHNNPKKIFLTFLMSNFYKECFP
jgi:hypothetical protein